MNFFELYQDICQGFSTIIVEDKSFFVKHLTPSEIGYLHDYFEKKKKDYERKGAETRENRLNEINWPEEKEKKKNKMKSQLDSWTLAKTRLVRDECRLTISEESKKKILNENLIIIYNGV